MQVDFGEMTVMTNRLLEKGSSLKLSVTRIAKPSMDFLRSVAPIFSPFNGC